jgi:regulator of replication initiation timing
MPKVKELTKMTDEFNEMLVNASRERALGETRKLIDESKRLKASTQKLREIIKERKAKETKPKEEKPKKEKKAKIVDEIQKLIDEVSSYEIPKTKKVKLTKVMKKLLN